MRFKLTFSLILVLLILVLGAFKVNNDKQEYKQLYSDKFRTFKNAYHEFSSSVNASMSSDQIKSELKNLRVLMKGMDFWWRYSNPIQYKLINGPLPVEWETEVFEKFEKPYKRIGKGMTLAEQALDEGDVQAAIEWMGPIGDAIAHLVPDSMAMHLESPDHFAFCNRLFLLNLATIYTTGFECPDTASILPELKYMLESVEQIYQSYNLSFPEQTLDNNYIELYSEMREYVQSFSSYISFDHFTFISKYVNVLYGKQAQWLLKNDFKSHSMLDYSLNKQALSIFDKSIYYGQNSKGVFLRVNDPLALAKINELGRLLFNDPILSGNNQRSCASCHRPGEYYTDTSFATSERFDHNGRLTRNTPSTINAEYNHLIMMDGKFISLQEQALGVITNPAEMGSKREDIMAKILSCKSYKALLEELCALTPQAPKPSLEHVLSALTLHYSGFSVYRSAFDLAMEQQKVLDVQAVRGFNLFMSKAQCGTCHFLPHFNGVKPPYVGSEFEVLGVPDDTSFTNFGKDSGRFNIHPADETLFAFRTGTLKNISKTAPYMHNGVFRSLREVIIFYNNGGGAGRGIEVQNQTLSQDKLGLTEQDIQDLLVFLESLDEAIEFQPAPTALPESKIKDIKNRKVGGSY